MNHRIVETLAVSVISLVAAVEARAGSYVGREFPAFTATAAITGQKSPLGPLRGKVALLALGAAGLTSGALDAGCVRESNYFCINVTDATDPEGHPVKALHLDKLLHSYVALDDPTYLAYGYEKIFGEIANFVARQEPRLRVLFIGGGGYTMPRHLSELYPGRTLEVIEIHPCGTRVALHDFALRAGPPLVHSHHPPPHPP